MLFTDRIFTGTTPFDYLWASTHAHEDGSMHTHDHGHDHDHDHDHGPHDFWSARTTFDDGMMRVDDGNPFSSYSTFGSKWGNPNMGTPGGTVTWSLPGGGLSDATGSNFFTGLTQDFNSFLNFNWQQAIEAAFDTWSEVADIDFQFVANDTSGDIGTGNGAQIRIVAAYIDGESGPNTLGQAYGPGSSAIAGDLVMDSGNTWTYDLFYVTMLHEIGHTLGLDHSATTAVMSPTINTNLNGLTADDIAGIQSIYGARNGGNAPSDDYAGNSSTTGTIGPNGTRTGELEVAGDRDWFAIEMVAGVSYTIDLRGGPSNAGTLTDPYLYLYDSSSANVATNDDGGTSYESRIVYTPTTGGTYYIGAGGYSDSVAGTYTLEVASAAGSNMPTAGDDVLDGTAGDDNVDLLAGDDTFEGLDGNDIIFGNAGGDTLFGGAGNDTLNGGLGADALAGGTGNDFYIVDNANDAVSENAGQGNDTVRAVVDYALTGGVENLILAGTAELRGTGNAGNNAIIGNESANLIQGAAGNDILQGRGGDDRLDGGVGNDRMIGGAGNDVYLVDSYSDTIVEAAGGGTDRVVAFINHTLADAVENLTLAGTVNNGQGNALDNGLFGNSGNNGLYGHQGNDVLRGEAGDDFLFGGVGNDRLIGGAGSDLLRGEAGADTFVFAPGGGAGTRDRIADFTDGTDRIDIQGFGITNTGASNDWMSATSSFANVSGGVVITWTDGSEVQITGTFTAQLTDADFIF